MSHTPNPAAAPASSVADFVDAVLHRRDPRLRDAPALSQRARAPRSGWQTWTYADVDADSHRLAVALGDAGAGPGDRVALLAESCADWAVAFFAVLRAGAVVVPLDPKLTDAELAPAVADAAPVLLISGPGLLATADALCAGSETLREVLALGAAGDTGHRATGAMAAVECDPDRPDPAAGRGAGDLALLLYTSGTTGAPKGVMLGLAALDFEARVIGEVQRARPGDVYVSILPLSHVFELTCGMLAPLRAGAHVVYAESLFPDEITSAMRHWRATHLVAVPLFLKLFKRGIERRIREGEPARRLLAAALGVVAAAIPSLPVRHTLFGSLHRNFGGSLGTFYAGGAPLDPDVARFFERLGIGVYQGYGLTETSPVVAMCTPWANALGSVGRPLPGVEVRIDAADASGEGEICCRGPLVMQGYHGRPDLTADVVDADGWLHTGDLGRVDDAGYLWVTGRRKNLIVLPSGKNVQPEEVETVLEAVAEVDEACVLPTRAARGLHAGTDQVTAVVVPTEAALSRYGRGEELERVLTTATRAAVRGLAAFKRPSRVLVRVDPFEKTPSRKVKRDAVGEWVRAHDG